MSTPRRIRARPSDVGSIVPWGIAATIGDPLLLVAPLSAAAFAVLALLGAGVTAAPGCTSTPGCGAALLVPAWSLPPFDAYQDAGAIQLAATATWHIWAFRVLAIVLRAAVFGVVANLALQRAQDAFPDLKAAAAAVRRRFLALLVLGLISAGVFGIPLVLGQGSLVAPGRPISQLGALVGQALLINAYLAVFSVSGPWRAVGAGFRWVRVRPLGHLMLVAAATASANGVFWLARAGEVGAERPITLAVFAAVHALLATVFLTAFARRFSLLYAEPPGARRRRRTKAVPAPKKRTRSGSRAPKQAPAER